MTSPDLTCPLCANVAGNSILHAREMMFGTHEAFDYGACASCESLWLLDVPEDLSPYYPPDYYSYRHPKPPSTLRAYLRRAWARHHLTRPTPLGSLLTRRTGTADFFDWAKRTGTGFESRILDVGCGQGALLRRMNWSGFMNLTGTDPFIEADAVLPSGIRLLRRELGEVEGTYDLVMCHHTLEHMRDPRTALKQMQQLLAPGGTLLVRIPLADSWARHHYNSDWCALDAPRHLFLMTRKSMALLEQSAGLREVNVVYDAMSFTLWASEQYRMGIPLMDADRSYFLNPQRSPFSTGQIEAFAKQARELNASGQGDTAAFYLKAA